jgi:hypothetical protein
MARKGGKREKAGRKKGIPNKSTQEIKEILSKEVDFAVVARKMFELVKGVTVREADGKGGVNVYEKEPNVAAARLLLEYGFGKPKEQIDVNHSGGVTILKDDVK